VFGLTFQLADISSIPVGMGKIEETYKGQDGYYHSYGNIIEIGT
jgi:hypothetical protein